MLKIGDIVKLYIEKMTFGGESLAYYNDMVIFVPMSIPGDEVEVEIISVKKSHCRGLIKAIIKPSIDRISDLSKVSFEDFLGCDFAMIKYEEQLKYKKIMTEDVLKRIGKLEDYQIFDTIGAENPYNYRNKIIEPFGKINGRIISGFYKRKSHDIFETKENWLQGLDVQEVLREVKLQFNKQKLGIYNEKSHEGLLRHVMVRKNTLGHLMIVIVIKGKENSKLKFALKKVIEKFENIKSVYISINNKKGNFAMGEENILFYGEEYLKEELFGIKFNISPLSFFQINIEQTKKLYSLGIEYFGNIEDKVIVDAYSGTGTIAMLLAKKAKKVYGIEYVESATKDAIKTAKENGIENVSFVNGKVEEKIHTLLEEGERVEGIMFDPPRKGIEESVLKSIARSGIKEIVYISCNPSTFARDMYILSQHGYKLDKVQPVDMFPQTNHVELVSRITRI